MGGSGGGRGTPIGNYSDLKRLAADELRRAESGAPNVFISFAKEDEQAVQALRAQAKKDLSEIEFQDWSVKTPYDSESAGYIRSRIEDRIRHSSMTVVYLSQSTAESQWVAWEVATSVKLGKKVVAVHKERTPPKKIPGFVASNKIEVVPWSKLKDKL